MAVWWLAEPVPLGATSLLPLVLFPLLGVASTREAAAPYANEIVYLFLAGFLLAAALERWNAHARIAFAMISVIGLRGRRVVLGIMIATAFISMWTARPATPATVYPTPLAMAARSSDDAGRRDLRT